jgi:hypothetical protein
MTRTTFGWIAATTASLAALSLLTAPALSAMPAPTGQTTTAVTAEASRWITPRTAPTTPKPGTTPTTVTTAVPAAAVAADFTSIFTAQVPALTDAGWAACASPIAWSVDTAGLSEAEAAEQIANLQWAFDQWSQASGLAFQYTGTTSLVYDDGAFTLVAADGSATPSRTIYLDFVPDSESGRLNGGVVGLASPSSVWQDSKEIVNGTAVFRLDYIASASVNADRALYLHELGHVLGLGHAAETANRMYPMVKDGTELGAGDITGVRTMLKPCTEGA